MHDDVQISLFMKRMVGKMGRTIYIYMMVHWLAIEAVPPSAPLPETSSSTSSAPPVGPHGVLRRGIQPWQMNWFTTYHRMDQSGLTYHRKDQSEICLLGKMFFGKLLFMVAIVVTIPSLNGNSIISFRTTASFGFSLSVYVSARLNPSTGALAFRYLKVSTDEPTAGAIG
jgi:hypothetical protein